MSFLARHGAHVIVLGGPLVLMAGMFAVLHLSDPERDRPTRPQRGLLPLALCWTAAGAIHLAVIGEHFEDAFLLGAFFVVLAAVQLSYAWALLTIPTPQLLVAGLVANLGVIGLWAFTRAVDVPFGLGGREPIGVVDLTATALELAAVLLTARALRAAPRLLVS